MKKIGLTVAGKKHKPRVHHHFAAWGGIKELLHVRDDVAVCRKDILKVLEYCSHPTKRRNTAYLGYALKMGWLEEIES